MRDDRQAGGLEFEGIGLKASAGCRSGARAPEPNSVHNHKPTGQGLGFRGLGFRLNTERRGKAQVPVPQTMCLKGPKDLIVMYLGYG